VASFYRFAALTELQVLRQELLTMAADLGVQGTILLAAEGVNGTLCGPDAAVRSLLARLRQVPGLEPLTATFIYAAGPVFQRLRVRSKREILSFGQSDVRPYLGSAVGTPVPPAEWNALIADPATLLIDTRNSYEVAIGSFAGAIDPATASFRDFPAWVEGTLRPMVEEQQPRAVALFCTGGIRCEKATALLRQRGFSGVHQLQGGILRYLQEIPPERSRWRGECFVFDQRVALNHQLQPGRHILCHACGLPLAPADQDHPAYRKGVSCRHCLAQFSDDDRARFAERQRQIEWARARGEAHLGMEPRPPSTILQPEYRK
jgi:UPF0176 protein